MKAFYIPIVLLASILCFSLWTGRYVQQQSDVWAAQLKIAAQHAQSNNWGKAADTIQQVYSGWNEQQFLFYTVMDHADLDEAQTLFAGSFAACQEQDSEDFHILLAQLSLQLQLLAETQDIRIENIL